MILLFIGYNINLDLMENMMLIALVLACGTEEKDTSDVSNELEEYEGDAAGECSDGADNDRDGKFDCDDEGCEGSPIATQSHLLKLVPNHHQK